MAMQDVVICSDGYRGHLEIYKSLSIGLTLLLLMGSDSIILLSSVGCDVRSSMPTPEQRGST
jgi:hypothetical protein